MRRKVSNFKHGGEPNFRLQKKNLGNIRGLVLEGFIDGSQNAVWRFVMKSASLQNYENRSN